jgi:hypothetical protein
MPTRKFHLGDLISVTTGRLVSPDHIGGVYAVVDFLTGEQHFTHQLPRACREITPELIRQHSWLVQVVVPEWVSDQATCDRWLAEATARWGTEHEVEQLQLGAYLGREPIAELREMTPHAQIIPVEIDREDPK